MTKIDCDNMPVTVLVSAEILDGDEPLDLALYDAMARAARELSQAAREDQRRAAADAAAA